MTAQQLAQSTPGVIYLAGMLALCGFIILTAAIIELWADAKGRAWERVETGRAERRAAYIRRKYLGIYKAMTGQKDPVGWAIPCTALSPDSRLQCDLETGHPSWHSCDGSLWYGDNWNVDEYADTQSWAVQQENTMSAADWAASNPSSHKRHTITDRVFVATWKSPLIGGCEISEQWIEEAA
jgi:hypothetical protein